MRYLLSFALVLICLVRPGFSQSDSEAIKRELHLRGIKLLKELEKPDQHQVENAFRSAAALDPGELVQAFISEFELKPEVVLGCFVQNVDYFPDLKLAFDSLKNSKLDRNHKTLVAELAYQLGTRDEDLERLLALISDYLQNTPLDEEAAANAIAEEPPTEKTQLQETQLNRRTEELWCQFHLGYLENHKPQPLAEFTGKVKDPLLRENFKLQWLPKAIRNELPIHELIECTNSFDSTIVAKYSLTKGLNQLTPARLQSEYGNQLVRHLIDVHATKRRRTRGTSQKLEYSFEFSRYGNEFPGNHFMSMYGLLADSEISDLYHKSKLSEREPDLELNLEFDFLRKPEKFPSDLSLIIGGGQTIMHRIPFGSAPLKGSFSHHVKAMPSKRGQPKWIIEFVLRFGWANRQIKPGEFPEESEILGAFKECNLDDADVANLLANNLDISMSPTPTPAAEELLFRMMKMLPEILQITTSHEIYLLADRIDKAPDSNLEYLFEQSFPLNARNKDDQSMYASQIAFAFAKRGQEKAVHEFLDVIPIMEEEAFACFQCSLAFPPRAEPDKRIWHSTARHTGGQF